MQLILTLTAAAFCSAAVSFTIAFTGIFKPVRDFITPINPKAGQLINCPWCLNHYVVFIMLTCGVPLIPVLAPIGFWRLLFNFCFTAFSLIGAGGLIHYVLLRAYIPVAEAQARREMFNRKPPK